jgi:hypothetical protein
MLSEPNIKKWTGTAEESDFWRGSIFVGFHSAFARGKTFAQIMNA